jgi:hypothetical protein
MARAKRRFEVEACMWARGRIPASSEGKAIETLMDLMLVDEDKLDALSNNDYDIATVATSEKKGGLSWSDIEMFRQHPISKIKAEIEAEDRAKATERKKRGRHGAAPARAPADHGREGAAGHSLSQEPRETVVSIEPRLAQRRQHRLESEFPIERQFSVTITQRKSGIFSFHFDGIDLTEETIDAVEDDVRSVADCLRKDRASFLEDDE